VDGVLPPHEPGVEDLKGLLEESLLSCAVVVVEEVAEIC